MGASVRPEPDPMLRLQYYKETGQGDMAKQYETYLRETQQWREAGPDANERVDRAARREATSEAERSSLNDPATTFVNFLDAATFGGAGLVTDALSPGTFRANRDARQRIYESIPAGERVALGIAGGLASPVRRLLPAPAKDAGLLKVMGRGAAEGAAQGAAQGFGENVGTTSGGVAPAVTGAAVGAAAGGLLSGAAVPAGRIADKMGIAKRVFGARPVDNVAFDLDDSMKRSDELLYGATRHEAAKVVSTPKIEDVLVSKTVRPFANIVRKSESSGNLTAAEQLLETYKLMSDAQRKAARSVEGSPKFQAKLDAKIDDIKLAKKRMLEAAAEDIPSLRPAVETHAIAASKADNAHRIGDAITDILGGKSAPGEKLTMGVDGGRIRSSEALRRAIDKLTPDEAATALPMVMGRGREVIRLTSNPVSAYGVRPSIFHAIRTPFQIDEFVKALQLKAGQKPTSLGEVYPELASRFAGRAANRGGLLDSY